VLRITPGNNKGEEWAELSENKNIKEVHFRHLRFIFWITSP